MAEAPDLAGKRLPDELAIWPAAAEQIATGTEIAWSEQPRHGVRTRLESAVG